MTLMANAHLRRSRRTVAGRPATACIEAGLVDARAVGRPEYRLEACMTKRAFAQLGLPAAAIVVGLAVAGAVRGGSDGAPSGQAVLTTRAVRVRELATRTDLRPPAISIR